MTLGTWAPDLKGLSRQDWAEQTQTPVTIHAEVSTLSSHGAWPSNARRDNAAAKRNSPSAEPRDDLERMRRRGGEATVAGGQAFRRLLTVAETRESRQVRRIARFLARPPPSSPHEIQVSSGFFIWTGAMGGGRDRSADELTAGPRSGGSRPWPDCGPQLLNARRRTGRTRTQGIAE
jgi:hypothetical protein